MSYKQERDSSGRQPSQLSFLLTPTNQIVWSEAIESKAGVFGPDGDAIARRERPPPLVRPKADLTVSYKTAGSRPGRIKTVSRPWNEQDESQLKIRQTTFDLHMVSRNKDASALWNFIKDSCSDEIWAEMQLCSELKNWRNSHDTYSLMELAEESANNLAKLGVTDLNTAWLADKQGDRSIVIYARDFKRGIEQLEKCGEVISESRRSAVFKKNVDQKHYEMVLTSLYTVPEGAEGYPLLETVITRLIDHDRTHPRPAAAASRPSKGTDSGAVAAFSTYSSGGSKQPNNTPQCKRSSLSSSVIEAHKSNPPCDNCGKADHKRKDCPLEDAECEFCHKCRHLRQFCHTEIHATGTNASKKGKKGERDSGRSKSDRNSKGGGRGDRKSSPPPRRRDRSRSR
eukprot:gene42372-52547_t